MLKVATVTYQRHDNFGAMLQCYALQKKLNEYGVDCDVLDYICDVSEHPFSRKALRAKGKKKYITGIIGAMTRLPRRKKFREFRTMLQMSEPVNDSTVARYADAYDGYIAGSDNIWNCDITGFDQTYFLSFVAENKKKTSFAASLGGGTIPKGREEDYKKALSQFAILNLREQSGAKAVEELTGKQTSIVCDPTVLLTKEDWEQISVDPDLPYKYVLAYQMVPSRSFVAFADRFAKDKDLRLVYIPFPYGFVHCKSMLSIGPREWLGLFQNAEYILTDSFHGTVFSVAFRKQFGVCISQLGERISNFLQILGLEDRIVKTAEELERLKPVDYDGATAKLDAFRSSGEKALQDLIQHLVGIREEDNR